MSVKFNCNIFWQETFLTLPCYISLLMFANKFTVKALKARLSVLHSKAKAVTYNLRTRCHSLHTVEKCSLLAKNVI